ncbi:isocitrate lyase/phosphoenolpyruvate mutase family protein [Comamonas humi]
MTHRSVSQKRAIFREMHQSGCFVLPNPWDAGSARVLAGLGFKALATTSSGHAWSCARADGQLSRAETLAHMRYMAEATDLPINADFESGFAGTPEGVAESVRLAVETGVAGISIEDSTGDPQAPLRGIAESVQRMRAARAAIDAAGGDTLLIGRAENFFVGRPDLDDTILRLQAYADAGADCLYAPGIRTREQISAVVAAVAPRPVNVLIGWASDLTLQDLAGLGVRRVSVGGALARAAWGGFLNAARSIAEHGTFDGFADAASGTELNALFNQPADRPPR